MTFDYELYGSEMYDWSVIGVDKDTTSGQTLGVPATSRLSTTLKMPVQAL